MSARVCIYGTGAIGGFLAARLAHAGTDVSCVARGAQLEAIRSGGLRLIEADREIDVEVPCSDEPAELGQQDIVIVALKAHALTENVGGIASLLGPDTIIVTMQNGLPWWYFHRDTSPLAGRHLETVDPGRRLGDELRAERAIGAIIYPAAEVIAPGVIRHSQGERFTLGEPGGETTARIESVCELMNDADLQASISADIRAEIWLKLSVNAAINPLSVVGGSAISEIVSDEDDRRYLTTLISEAQSVAASLGVVPLMKVDELIAALQAVEGHKTSMLMDYECGRPLELEALTGAVLEVASLMDVTTPGLRALYEQVRRRRV